MNKKSILKYVPYLLLVFMLLNLGVSLEIEHQEILLSENIDLAGGCFSSGGCGTVANSGFSEIFGIPLTYLGIISFLLMSLLLSFFIWNKLNYLDIIITVGLTIGSIAAFSFIFIQYYYIGAYCKYCLVVDFTTIISTFIWWWYHVNR